MKSFKELKVWQKGLELVEMVYKITASFPEEEKYGLCAQIDGQRFLFHQILRRGICEKQQRILSNFYPLLGVLVPGWRHK